MISRLLLKSILKPRYLIHFIQKHNYSMEEPKEIRFVDYKTEQFGDYPFIQSTFQSGRIWTPLKTVDQNLEGKQILVRARVHNSRGKGNSCFIVLRDSYSTLQACAFKSETVSKEMLKYISNVPNESIVDIVGTVVKPQKSIQSCSQQVEMQISNLYVVNRAIHRLPLQIVDASRTVEHNEFEPHKQEEEAKHQKTGEQEIVQEKKQGLISEEKLEKTSQKDKKTKQKKKREQEKVAPIVNMKTRLDNRVIDLRTTSKQAIFKLSSGICHLFREFCINNDFIQIHTPKLISGSSEGGSNVFTFSYFNRKACLAQSPQLYKQMCIMGDFQRVFEIGPVFRAQNAFTHRHMCQFVGMDLEMSIKQHYFEVLDFFGELFPYIFSNIEKRYGKQLQAINSQFAFTPFKCKVPVVKLTFAEGIQLLKDNGIQWHPMEDLNTEVEKKLGELVKMKYDTDFYMLHRYPANARPFYTMLCQDDPNYTCSYDFFMRGQQILSGAQRIHDPDILKKRAIEKGIDPSSLSDYIQSFRYGAFPHGGGGIGLQRVVMLYCGLKNIRNASLFPRDPHRITP